LRFDWLVVGAGFTGAIVAERLATQCDAKVLVIDRRDHIAGNAFDKRSDEGVLCHRYGPHIFHTNAEEVVTYLSRFTEWRPYEHRVVGMVDGRLFPIPFNLTSLAILFPPAEARRLTALLCDAYGIETHVPILKMRSAESEELRKLAEFIYANVFYGYTTKQWGLTPEELSPSVTARVPVRVSYDDRYFRDAFQQMPRDGYTVMFDRILAHPNITLSLATSYDDVKDEGFERVVYTGAIDAFFDFALGELPYRSLRFDFQTYRQERHQPVASINYPTSHAFTRITEMGHLTGEWSDVTTVAIEYPLAHQHGVTEPYYPIPRDENQALHSRYVALAKKEAPNIVFAGRLGDYNYYNMDQAAAGALSLFRRIAAMRC
jgi:UDP-galactopyranose mutase